MAFRIKDRCLAYGEPLWYLAIAFYGSPFPFYANASQGPVLTYSGCLIALLRIASSNPRDLISIPKIKDAVFSQFWLRMGKTVRPFCQEHSSSSVHQVPCLRMETDRLLSRT